MGYLKVILPDVKIINIYPPRMMCTTEEFGSLVSTDIFFLLKNNLKLTVILTYVRSFCFATTEEELSHVFGSTDQLIWRKVENTVTIKRMSDMALSMPFDTQSRKK